MQQSYYGFLDLRAAQRRLAAKFARPRALLAHVIAFVVVMSAIWAYGVSENLWFHPDNFILPMLIGAVWSGVLALHGLIHLRRSAVSGERREMAVEAEMTRLIENNDNLSDDDLFATHRRLEAELEHQGRWSLALFTFALINALSWVVSFVVGPSSWPFQTTPFFAGIVVVGMMVYLQWRQQRLSGRSGWFTRWPLAHTALFFAGSIGLLLAGSARMMNPWDAERLIQLWGVGLLLHVLWSVAIWPLVKEFAPEEQEREREEPAKRKTGSRLALGDDGEVFDIDDSALSVKQARNR
jgi:hypothetical protein